MVPILMVLIAAAVLMVMCYRQERVNERNEAEALERTAALARSYAQDVAAAPHGFPGQKAVRGIAERHDGRLLSYARSENSLTTTVRFFGEYEDNEHVRRLALPGLPLLLRWAPEGAAGVPPARTTPLEKCDVI
ncbi:hypothetical protein ABTZ58_39090 [Streptomyces sp. NPDC094143]|uniref:hypothetical protein n=1 Tax=Streptomyces sp. NPDC094143 TaxID=3155310 RepID=UPI003330BDB9